MVGAQLNDCDKKNLGDFKIGAVDGIRPSVFPPDASTVNLMIMPLILLSGQQHIQK